MIKIDLMIRFLGIITFLLIGQLTLVAQIDKIDPKIHSRIDSLASLLALDTLFDSKQVMVQELESLILDSVFKENINYAYEFEYLNTLTSKDQKLTLISGFYMIETGMPEYFLFYQYRGDEYIEGSILNSVGTEFSDPDMVDLRDGEWFGAMYYQIQDFSYSEDIQLYLVFGANLYKGFERRKIVEPIYFDEGQIKFGYPIFKLENKPKLQPHYIIQYSRDSAPTFRYDEDLNLIIFDHLMPVPSPFDRQQMTMVPDGTYEAFELKNKIWHHISELPIEKLAEPPNINRERNSTRDILGREN